jgi:hypothetical protein
MCDEMTQKALDIFLRITFHTNIAPLVCILLRKYGEVSCKRQEFNTLQSVSDKISAGKQNAAIYSLWSMCN